MQPQLVNDAAHWNLDVQGLIRASLEKYRDAERDHIANLLEVDGVQTAPLPTPPLSSCVVSARRRGGHPVVHVFLPVGAHGRLYEFRARDGRHVFFRELDNADLELKFLCEKPRGRTDFRKLAHDLKDAKAAAIAAAEATPEGGAFNHDNVYIIHLRWSRGLRRAAEDAGVKLISSGRGTRHLLSLGDLGRCAKNTNGVDAAYALLRERGWPVEGWWQLD